MLTVLAAGVDRLELSARGSVRAEVLSSLERAKLEAQRIGEPELFTLPGWERTFLVQGHGRRAYPYVLQGANYGLTVRPNGELPPVRVDIYSAWLHAIGATEAAAEVGEMLRAAVFVVPPDVVVSRVDIYADVQGCEFRAADLGRFVTRARERTTYHMGQRFTGFRFGRGGPMLVRVYDKTAEIERQGETWLPERWGERRDGGPVWRVELQVRRPVLAEFGLRSPGEVLASVQDVWWHGVREWLTLRRPTGQATAWRWPLDPMWVELQGVKVAATSTGAWRKRRAEADRERAIRFLQGHLTTWGALGESDEIDEVLRAARAAVVRYLAEMGRTFRDEVSHKRARRQVMEEAEGSDGERRAVARPPRHGVGGGSEAHRRGSDIGRHQGLKRSRTRENDRGGEQPPALPEGHEPNLSVEETGDDAKWSERGGSGELGARAGRSPEGASGTTAGGGVRKGAGVRAGSRSWGSEGSGERERDVYGGGGGVRGGRSRDAVQRGRESRRGRGCRKRRGR